MDEGLPENVWGKDSELSETSLKISLKTTQLLAKLPVNINIETPELKLHTL